MTTVNFKGTPINISGDLPAVGSKAPAFSLRSTSLQDEDGSSFAGRKLLLNIFPSVDTGICAQSVRTFNEKAAGRDDVAVLCVSADLPFAHKRFCGAEGIENVHSLSTFDSSFAEDYGLKMLGGPLRGCLARAIVVLGADGTVLYTELVPEIVQEPDYDAALAAL